MIKDISDKVWNIRVSAQNAMFADPVCSNSGELMTYLVPPYSAIRGMLDNLYWKPTVKWVPTRLRVMNPILTETKSLLSPRGAFIPVDRENTVEDEMDRNLATYLRDVVYHIEAHLEWNMDRADMEADRDISKHLAITEKALKHGGRRPIYMGKNDGMCTIADVEPCVFDEGIGAYDHFPVVQFGTMLHSVTYPTAARPYMTTQLFNCVMERGVITYPRPEECTMVRKFTSRAHQDLNAAVKGA